MAPFDATPADLPSPDTAPAQDPVADVLMRAAQIIRERGIAHGTHEDLDGGVCVSRALMLAQGFDDKQFYFMVHAANDTDAGRALKRHLGLSRALWTWNDAFVFVEKRRFFGLFRYRSLGQRPAADVISALEGAARARLASMGNGK